MIKVQLDSTAMLALFPPGTQAEIDLKAAVTDNFARKRQGIKLLEPDARALLTDHLEKIRLEAENTINLNSDRIFTEYFKNIGIFNPKHVFGLHSVALTEAFKLEVVKEVRAVVRKIISEDVTATINTLVQEAFKNNVSVGTISHDIRVAIKEEVRRELISGIIKG